MNRRNFLGLMVGGVVTAAAVQTWPFRVYSFPTKIIIAQPHWVSSLEEIEDIYGKGVLDPQTIFETLSRNANRPSEVLVDPNIYPRVFCSKF